jgi:hypothetical protein
MVSTRPKKKGRGLSATHPFSVLVEDMRSQFQVFGESLQGLREHMDTRFEQVDRRFEQVDRRFEQVDRRFDDVESGIVLLKDVSLDHTRALKVVKRDLKELKAASIEQTHQLNEVRSAVDRLTVKVDQKVDRAEVERIVDEALARPRSH